MKTKRIGTEMILMGARVPLELRDAYTLASTMAGFLQAAVVEDALRLYLGMADELLLKRQETFLLAWKLVQERKRLEAQLALTTDAPAAPAEFID